MTMNYNLSKITETLEKGTYIVVIATYSDNQKGTFVLSNDNTFFKMPLVRRNLRD